MSMPMALPFTAKAMRGHLIRALRYQKPMLVRWQAVLGQFL